MIAYEINIYILTFNGWKIHKSPWIFNENFNILNKNEIAKDIQKYMKEKGYVNWSRIKILSQSKYEHNQYKIDVGLNITALNEYMLGLFKLNDCLFYSEIENQIKKYFDEC